MSIAPVPCLMRGQDEESGNGRETLSRSKATYMEGTSFSQRVERAIAATRSASSFEGPVEPRIIKSSHV